MENATSAIVLAEGFDGRPVVSVIICTYNRARSLERTLDALAAQTYPPDRFEVMVIDDGSADETKQICERIKSRRGNFSYLRLEKNSGLSTARNIGVRKARGERLLFTDDDCIPANSWVEKLSTALAKGKPVVTGTIETPPKPYIKLCHNISAFYGSMGFQKADSRKFLVGANMGFARHILDELGGFQPNREIGEDTEIMLRAWKAGYTVNFVADAVVMHDPDRITLGSIMRYSAQHGAASVRLRNQHKDLLRTPFILRYPPLVLLAAPFIALKVTSSIYLRNRKLARLWWTMPTVYATKLAWCWGAAQGLRRTFDQGTA